MHEPIEIGRIRFWQGQRLRAGDFRYQLAGESQVRWWHNRALHNTFGVRYGFAVTPISEAGSLVAVEIGCGVAYDCFGRELIQQKKRRIDLPAVGEPAPAKMTLVALFQETSQFPSRRELSGTCATSPEAPRLLWKESPRLEVKDGVPIARLNYEPVGGPVLDESFSALRARPLARPRIESGTTVPGHTPWELWSEKVVLGRVMAQRPLGVQVMIDTSAAGFSETPRYFAWLEGSLWDRSNIEFFPAPFAHIDGDTAGTKQFLFRLWMPTIIALIGHRARTTNQHFATEFLNFAQSKKLYVCWLGVQCDEDIGCEELPECQCHTVNEDQLWRS